MGRIIETLERTARARGDAPALQYRRDGRWHPITWPRYVETVKRAGRALMTVGVQPGDHVTIIGFNCPEWFISDLGAIAAGAVPAGIYTTSTADQCQYIAAHCDARVAFVENDEHLAKFLAVRDALPALRAIVVMHGGSSGGGVLTWNDFLALADETPEQALDDRLAAQKEDDVCTLIYTSGTTGVPKGVMLTHRNLTWLIETAARHGDLRPGDSVISYLPLSHVAEQGFSLYGNVALGTTVWFAESLETLGETLKEVRPHYFLAVPRVWEKMQAKMESVGATAPAVRRKIVRWARGIGLRAGYARQRGERLPFLYPLADKLVFSKVRVALGLDRARSAITGAAPIAPSTLEFFLSLGIPVCELYGMSECTATTTISTPEAYRTGKVGKALPGTEIKLAEDGEICIRGPHVFAGYYRDPVATAEALDGEGWLHSGDVGEIDADGWICITDRKKELIITAGGENIAPSFVEGMLKSISAIGQAVVVGDRRRYLAALITLNPDKIASVASSVGSAATTAAEAAACPKFNDFLQREIDAVNGRLARVQTVKRFVVLPTELSVDGGELTATMKVKRKVVSEKYASVIEQLYAP